MRKNNVKNFLYTILILCLMLNICGCNVAKKVATTTDLIDTSANDNNEITEDKSEATTSEVQMPVSPIYNSKDELFVAFYTEFYNYILDAGGSSHLESHNIMSLDDYLTLHKTWTGGARGMAEVGDVDAKYFMTTDTNGKLIDQKDKKGFIGYCLTNYKFVDFIIFLQEFFFYWRLDEGYTDFNDSIKKFGSDFFHEPSASAVDTAKFFFFDKDTLPDYLVARKHIPEMYDRIPYLK